MNDKIINSTELDQLRLLQEHFINELPAKFENLQHAWKNYKQSSDNSDFHRLVHSMSGSSGTFGFPILGERARKLEILIQQLENAELDKKSITEIEKALISMQQIAEKGPDRQVATLTGIPKPYPLSHQASSLIYVLEDDVELAEETAQQLQHFGYRVELFHTTKALQEGVARQSPDVLLADIHLPEGSNAGPEVTTDISLQSGNDIPVIFTSGHNTWQDRLNAVRAGGQAYLTKPININVLVEQLDNVTGKQYQSQYRILIVEDTELLAQHYSFVLQTAGMSNVVLNKPEKILDVLEAYRPDLILMDIYMPGCSGVEAAQVIRQHSTYTNLPIVYLSTEKGLDQQLDALHVGGDDFLQKPINDNHLVAAVRIRARRFRQLSELMNRDSLTGLLNHINLKVALDREIAQADRRSAPLSFVMLDIDEFKLVNDTYGHPVGDQVIKSLARLLSQRVRKGDIAGRYGGEEFALILPDTPPSEALQLVENLRQQFEKIKYRLENGEFSATFSAGIASCPPYNLMENLITDADEALYKAKDSGRNQVVMGPV